jgi:copper chaperone CopZ
MERQYSSKPYYPSSSELPFNPKRLHHEKSKRRSSANSTDEILRRKSSADVGELNKSPDSSSRFLLSDEPFNDQSSDATVKKPNTHKHELVNSNSAVILKHYSQSAREAAPVFNSSTRSIEYSPALLSSSSQPPPRNHQVVVLRVSIHCKGCEGKIRKHISKMKGVTSFDIDLTTKKVTVIGEVTPLGVLESVSRVKSAQIWPSSSSSSTINIR